MKQIILWDGRVWMVGADEHKIIWSDRDDPMRFDPASFVFLWHKHKWPEEIACLLPIPMRGKLRIVCESGTIYDLSPTGEEGMPYEIRKVLA